MVGPVARRRVLRHVSKTREKQARKAAAAVVIVMLASPAVSTSGAHGGMRSLMDD